ncbi:c-type cytochrome [Massilia sp. IC2-477]|uniref:c-type cytochrome n=1 Tax=Massilia sp. IC2-477 TaxID=2887198 RepID=UPI001D10BBFF|nr:c-type cytochrome [Massilia sp. IC2-477]MCC2957577.1 c-type cytochrome [Massilia sp. IC2-477]
MNTFSLRNPWFVWSVAIVAAIACAAALVGMVWVPRAHARAAMESLWESVCRAAGVPAAYRPAALPETAHGYPSGVIVHAAMMAGPQGASRGRGATLAMGCTMCHGARGTGSGGAPHLAGQAASSTYKQLRDFASGHRPSAVMGPLVLDLSDQDMRDLAAYYASLDREHAARPHAGAGDSPRLVKNGDPMRAIGACASCHAVSAARPATPVLDGMPETYLAAQLRAFRDGRRGNDLHRQMRNAAHGLSDGEIVALSRYYAGR